MTQPQCIWSVDLRCSSMSCALASSTVSANKAFGAIQTEGSAIEGADHACRVLYCKQTGAERVGGLARAFSFIAHRKKADT